MRRKSRSIVCALLLVLCAGSQAASAQDRYAGVVESILAAWKTADVVCLGENHGRLYDSDLRIALVRHPSFPNTVRVIVVEFANPAHQALIDRFILEGAPMSRDELSPAWRDANGAEVWESPIYEKFLRAVREVNLGLPREKRVRVLGGDTRIDWGSVKTAEDLVPLLNAGLTNRGKNIRDIIAGQVLDAGLKGLAVYGGGHCEKLGGGFPGDLAGRYPEARMWSVNSLFEAEGARRGKQLFGLGDKPAYVVITGTKWASVPANDILWRMTRFTMGDMVDAIVYHGNVPDSVVRADLTDFKSRYGAELERRRKLLDDAQKLQRRD